MTDSPTDPLFLRKAKTLYTALDALAEDEYVDGLPARLFRGQLQTVYKSVRPQLSSSHYSRLLRGLKACGSMTMLQRGARNTDTIIALHHVPTVDQWKAYERSPLTGKIDYATIKSRIDEIEQEGGSERDALNTLVEEVKRQGQLLEKLEKQIQALQPK